MNEELLYNQLYDKTKDCGRTQFVNLLMEKERENKNLKDEIYKSNAVADTNRELAESYYKENQQLKKHLQQREEIINKAKEFIEKHNETIGKLYFKCSNMYLLSEIKEDLLKILNNKGDENNGL